MCKVAQGCNTGMTLPFLQFSSHSPIFLPPLPFCVTLTLGKFLNHSLSQIPHLWSGEISHRMVVKFKWICASKALAQWLSPQSPQSVLASITFSVIFYYCCCCCYFCLGKLQLPEGRGCILFFSVHPHSDKDSVMDSHVSYGFTSNKYCTKKERRSRKVERKKKIGNGKKGRKEKGRQ